MLNNKTNKRKVSYVAIITVFSAMFLSIAGVGLADYTELSTKYLAALKESDDLTMHELVVKNKEYIPAELRALTDRAVEPKMTKEKSYESFLIAESMARVYMETTGDTTQLKAVERAKFESRLDAPVSPKVKNGMYTIITPLATDHEKNVFVPNNLVIQKGDSVTWVNKDSVAHLFSSMPFIGRTGIRSPKVGPGESFTYKFDKAGTYYYICYIHRSMLGKITVEGAEEPEPPVINKKPEKSEPVKGLWER